MTRLLAVTLFLSAFLLFCCQPMVGKMLLPSLGGAAAVWTTCVLFFQAMLLAGYLYAYVLGRLATFRVQFVVHAALAVVVFLALPIRFGENALPGNTFPVAWELGQLMRSVALPFFVVSTTAPLIQNWFSRTTDVAAKDPYFLYAASNVGSLLALMVYPFVLEPRFGVAAQSRWWSAGYGLLVVLLLISIATLRRAAIRTELEEIAESLSWRSRMLWLAAAFVPSALMLAVTTHLSVNLAAVPFLWTLPLAVYLLTFILAFGRRVRISSDQISRVAPALLLVLIPIFAAGTVRPAILYLGLLSAHLILLFVGGLLCHTELARNRPKPAHLTEYYAWIALGGVLGGVFAALIAPMIFTSVLEYPLLVATLAFFRRPQKTRWSLWDLSFPAFLIGLLGAAWILSWWLGYDFPGEHAWTIAGYILIALGAFVFHRRRWWFAGGLAALILLYAVVIAPSLEEEEPLYAARNFFGVKKVVYEVYGNQRKLLNGDTMHGLEGLDPARAGQPLSYYHITGPLGDVMTMLDIRPDQHIGAVGLGSGSIAGYSKSNRHITFFEIDPQVPFIARSYFTYLPTCGEHCDVVLGDGRLSILDAPDGEFDLLILDAFNSDAIPAHLLSREAIEIYRKKLKPNGAVLFHVSNRYLRVRELVTALARDAGLPALYREDNDISEFGKARSTYVIVALDPEAIRPLAETWSPVTSLPAVEPWTDDYSNLWALLKW